MALTFPLSLVDTSLVFAVTAIVLLVTYEIISPYYGAVNLKINRKRLKNAALVMSTLFLATLVIRIVTIILNLKY